MPNYSVAGKYNGTCTHKFWRMSFAIAAATFISLHRELGLGFTWSYGRYEILTDMDPSCRTQGFWSIVSRAVLAWQVEFHQIMAWSTWQNVPCCYQGMQRSVLDSKYEFKSRKSWPRIILSFSICLELRKNLLCIIFAPLKLIKQSTWLGLLNML